MKMKKLGITAVSILTSLSLMAACSANSSTSSSSNAAKVEKITIGYPAGDTITSQSLQKLIKNFNAENKNYKVTASPIAGNYSDTLKTQMASKTQPDIFQLDPQLIPSLVQSNQLLGLDDHSSDLGFNDIENNLLKSVQYENKTYAIPTDYSTLVLFYNKKMLKDAGIEPPKTWDDLVKDAKVLTKGKVKGLVLQNEIARFQPFLYSNGGTMMKDGKPSVNSKENAEALQFYESLYKDKIAATPQDLGVGWDGDAFSQGLAAMTVEGNWMYDYVKKQAPDLDFGVVQIPVKKQPASMLFIGTYAVSANTKNKDGAIEFLKYITSKDGIMEKVNDGSGSVIPSRKSLEDKYLKIAPDRKVFIDAVPYASQFEYGLNSPDVIKQMNDSATALQLGKETNTQTVLNNIQAAIGGN